MKIKKYLKPPPSLPWYTSKKITSNKQIQAYPKDFLTFSPTKALAHDLQQVGNLRIASDLCAKEVGGGK